MTWSAAVPSVQGQEGHRVSGLLGDSGEGVHGKGGRARGVGAHAGGKEGGQSLGGATACLCGRAGDSGSPGPSQLALARGPGIEEQSAKWLDQNLQKYQGRLLSFSLFSG